MSPRPNADDLHVAPPRVRADDAFLAQLATVSAASTARESRLAERGASLRVTLAAASVAAVLAGGAWTAGGLMRTDPGGQDTPPAGDPYDSISIHLDDPARRTGPTTAADTGPDRSTPGSGNAEKSGNADDPDPGGDSDDGGVPAGGDEARKGAIDRADPARPADPPQRRTGVATHGYVREDDGSEADAPPEELTDQHASVDDERRLFAFAPPEPASVPELDPTDLDPTDLGIGEDPGDGRGDGRGDWSRVPGPAATDADEGGAPTRDPQGCNRRDSTRHDSTRHDSTRHDSGAFGRRHDHAHSRRWTRDAEKGSDWSIDFGGVRAPD